MAELAGLMKIAIQTQGRLSRLRTKERHWNGRISGKISPIPTGPIGEKRPAELKEEASRTSGGTKAMTTGGREPASLVPCVSFAR